MRITLYGAAGGVTGSAYYIDTGRSRVLLDFGTFQGLDADDHSNSIPRGLNVRNLDAVVVTHAHNDHTGRLPLLVKAGYKGPVYCTPATEDLTRLILLDSAKVQAQDAERLNRKRERAGEQPIEPLYDEDDARRLLRLCETVEYNTTISIAPDIQIRFVDAGHLLGSASVQVSVEEEGETKTVVFSGDVGPQGAPILRDPVNFDQANLVFLESTYGDRDHRPLEASLVELRDVIRATVERGGKILMPVFAMGRTQTMLYVLGVMARRRELPRFPIFLDSPLAIEATEVYTRYPNLVDRETRQLYGDTPLADDLETVQMTESVEESRRINNVKGPCLIMAGSGMCTGGRILHHLKQHVWRSETAVVFCGYQAQGTLGRRLVDGAKYIYLFGEKIIVRGSVHTINGFSAHAGQSELADWIAPLAQAKPRLALTHGEDGPRQQLAGVLQTRYGLQAELPIYGQVITV